VVSLVTVIATSSHIRLTGGSSRSLARASPTNLRMRDEGR
jgi:hypothetical protein